MAIEYYDSISNQDFHNYYINKINELMSKNHINKYLDNLQKGSNIEQTNILDYHEEKLREEIFPENREAIKKNYNKTLDTQILKSFEKDDLNEKIKLNNLKQKFKIYSALKNYDNNYKEKENEKEKLSETLKDFNLNLDKIKDNIDSDLQKQLNLFEQLKRKKKENAKNNTGIF